MPGQVEIINIALARLGESPIQSLDEGSVPANAAKLIYEEERRAALRGYPWNFALKKESLAKLEDGAVDFRGAFALPADCLRITEVTDAETRQSLRYVTRGRTICADADRILVEYVSDIKDTSLYDSKVVELLTYRLASALAMPVKGSPELTANYMNLYNSLASEAAVQSAREEKNRISDNPYLEARM